ncbi:MAG: hypothetical protein PHE61_01115 [Candidatus Omnitrophica bacterium]|nr:hypothetical protein [Candidatus Omnitrophota bacterium]
MLKPDTHLPAGRQGLSQMGVWGFNITQMIADGSSEAYQEIRVSVGKASGYQRIRLKSFI